MNKSKNKNYKNNIKKCSNLKIKAEVEKRNN